MSTLTHRPPAPPASPVRARTPRAAWRREGRWAALFLGPQLAFLLVFLVGPLLFALGLAFMRWDGLGEKSWVGLANFSALLQDGDFGRSVLNTVLLAVLTVPFGLFTALLLALALHNVKGRTVYRVVYFLPVVTSSVAVAVIWQVILAPDGAGILNGTVERLFGFTPPDWLASETWVIVAIAAVTVWSSLGLNVVIFLAGLSTIPANVLEAARIDGAGPLRMFRSIYLPMLSPTLFFCTVVSVISSFQAFDQIYVLVNPAHNDGARTIVYHVYEQGFRKFEFGMSSAASLVLLGLTLLVTLVQFGAQKRFVHYES